jgi:glycosyltransferase involved in cell wall biosynthesis
VGRLLKGAFEMSGKAFISLPDLHGHRQIYCREFCSYFLSRDFEVTVATDTQGLERYEGLASLSGDPRVRFVADTWSAEASSLKQLRELTAAVREADASVVLLAEADGAHGLLASQILRKGGRLPGRRIGLFIRSTNYLHQIERPRAGRLPRAVVAAYSYRPLSLAQPRIFHEVVTPRFNILDAALCLDEVFVADRKGLYGWMPDIAASFDESAEGDPEAAAWRTKVSAFIEGQNGRPVIVYVGTPQPRRGYEQLLELACEVDGCFLHCGESPEAFGYRLSELPARDALLSRSAILESGGFYQSFQTALATFGAGRCVALPYDRHHLGSSGVMLQALQAGRPLLVPDQGLMGWRVRNFGLGLTFTPGDRRDMVHKFSLLQNTPSDFFTEAISRFLAYFTKGRFEAAMDGAVGLAERRDDHPASETLGAALWGPR